MPHFPVFKSDANSLWRIFQNVTKSIKPQWSVLADIEKSFLTDQTELPRQESNELWLKDINKPVNSTDNLDAYRFCRVLFGAASLPFLLNATIQYHLNQKYN